MADFAPSKAPNPVMGTGARRSTRIAHAVPLTVSGQNKIGKTFLERTQAVSLNCHGCRFPSRHDYRPGSWVTLEVPNQQINGKARPVRAQVRFIRLPRSPQELYQVGVELETPANVWGIKSPPEDWLRFPGSLAAAAQPAVAVAPAPEPQVIPPFPEKIHVLPTPSKVEASETTSPGTDAPAPPASTTLASPTKPARIVVSPDQLLRALEAKLQQAAEKAVASAVSKAVQAIENASQASVRQIEEHWVEHREKLVTSAREELLGRLQAELAHAGEHLRKQFEVSLARAQETAARLEKSATQVQPALAEVQGFLQEAARELQNQFAARLRETADRAAAEFSDETVRLSDRQLARLTEKAQAATGGAAAQLEARAAEARSQLETAAGTALAEFHQNATAEIHLAVTEARKSVESSLASFAAEKRADWEARQRAWQDELARASEKEVEQFRQRLETILNSWMAAAVSAVNEQSKTLLDSLAKRTAQQLQEPGRGPTSR